MAHKPMHPFRSEEWELLMRCATGEGSNWDAISRQVDSLRYASPTFRAPTIFGVSMRSYALRRRARRLNFEVGWGIGSEDWQLGDRRPFRLRDVALRSDSGAIHFFTLDIAEGRIRTLAYAGTARCEGEPIVPCQASLKVLSEGEWYFVNPEWAVDNMAPSSLSVKRLLREPYRTIATIPAMNSDDAIVRWIDSVKTYRVPDSNRRLELQIRLGRPGTEKELVAFEQRNAIVLPNELRSFWGATNGASFFGDPLFGTYDAPIFRDANTVTIVLSQAGDCQDRYLTTQLTESGGSQKLRVRDESISEPRIHRVWGSLKDSLETLFEARASGYSAFD